MNSILRGRQSWVGNLGIFSLAALVVAFFLGVELGVKVIEGLGYTLTEVYGLLADLGWRVVCAVLVIAVVMMGRSVNLRSLGIAPATLGRLPTPIARSNGIDRILNYVWLVILSVLVYGTVSWLVTRPYVAFTGDSGGNFDFLAEIIATSSWPILLVVLCMTVLIVPAFEELFYRGLIYGHLRRYGYLIGVAGSAAVFGYAHFFFSLNTITAFTMGVILAILYELTQSLWIPFAVHALVNLAAANAAYFLGGVVL